MERTVLITGGSSGIGTALVKRFAGEGHNVVFTYKEGRDRAFTLVESLGKSVRAVHLDQGDWVSHQDFISKLNGPVDILINNAALGSATVKRCSNESHLQDQALLQVNAVGVLWLTQQLLPGMLKRGFGKIVMVSSVGGGISQFPGFKLADGMSKAAIVFMAKQLAAELHHAPVDVFAVCPGATDTPMFGASTLDDLTPQARQELVDSLPKSRLIDPAEIADLISYLCRDGSSFMHGAVIDASMGLGVNPGLLSKNTHGHVDATDDPTHRAVAPSFLRTTPSAIISST